ncbi:MAG: hypothetical protein WBF99_12520 [Xanthobacteraceae bacterium]
MSPNSVVNALVATKSASLEAVGSLHGLYYHWEKLDRHERAIALSSAKHELERALVAVLAAEKDIAPTVKSEPSNVVQIGSEYQRNLDTVAEIVGAPQFDGAAS